MLGTSTPTQAEFYREFLMARGKFDPSEFGVSMSKDEFIDEMAGDFNDIYRGQWTVDELLLHPRESLWFCDEIRRKHGYFDLPDDIILRTILQRRKNP